MNNGEFDFARIAFDVRYEGRSSTDGWEHYKWTVYVRGSKFPYQMGTGCVDRFGRPEKPHIKKVMHSLLLDMSAGEMPFEEFCSEFGYDEDSRKAHDLWEECGKAADTLRSLFSPAEIRAMQKALEDY